MNKISQIYTQLNFYEALFIDLRAAIAWVVICSPYITSGRLKGLIMELRLCIARGVRVCVFLQRRKVRAGESQADPYLEANVQMLRDAGVHVSFRERMHEKLIVIDDRILWEGSLNALSQFETTERMRRWDSLEETRAAVRLHHLTGCESCSEEFAMTNENDQTRMKRFGQIMANARMRRGWSQAELAAKASVGQRIISSVETGNDAKVTTIFKICEQLDLELCVVNAFLVPAVANLLAKSEL
jgi:DNA-binding XRE family transcriptional regulator